ncbi:PAS domain-containing protein [Methylobacterium gossipiicola]|uniref:PAS domain S-box-containing protein n=1 Tax=Methylobacterium gossipiicola TaxID=582675 RepID=A0A1I2V9Q5_9HYPH|nr:PAS domain-containing protein [Methylobacterium gossipiicola]SFG83881.1 PAS domain S-box-containing protein [Methylobacterium gossipiicola]
MDAAAYGFTDLERLRAALDASCVVGTWDWDHVVGAVIYDEGAARFLTGQPELAGRHLRGPAALAAVHPSDLTWLMEHMLRTVQNGGLVLAEYRVFEADGAVRWLLSRGRTYHDAAGRPERSHGILIDITEMRDGGERYILGTEPMAENRLMRAADLALTLKGLLGADVPPEVSAAADRLLLSLGRAIARRTERYAH